MLYAFVAQAARKETMKETEEYEGWADGWEDDAGQRLIMFCQRLIMSYNVSYILVICHNVL